MRPGRGHARFDGPAVRADPRRARLLRHHRGLHPGRDHRNRRRAGHRDGADLDAGDDPLQIQHPLHDRRAGRLGHDHPARAAVAGADRARRPARQVGRRHVSRRVGTVGHPDRPVRTLHAGTVDLPAGVGAGGAEGGAHAHRLGAVEEVPDGHHPIGRADLRRAGHDDARPDHADRGRRDGRGGRDRARGDPPPGSSARPDTGSS